MMSEWTKKESSTIDAGLRIQNLDYIMYIALLQPDMVRSSFIQLICIVT